MTQKNRETVREEGKFRIPSESIQSPRKKLRYPMAHKF